LNSRQHGGPIHIRPDTEPSDGGGGGTWTKEVSEWARVCIIGKVASYSPGEGKFRIRKGQPRKKKTRGRKRKKA
jgi:hypothetical protein